MRRFVFLGLDQADQVLASETLSVEHLEEARALARERLATYPKVELWADAVCVYRNRRAPPADGVERPSP